MSDHTQPPVVSLSTTEPGAISHGSAKLGSKTYLDLNLASHHFVEKNNPQHRVWNGRQSRPYNEENFGIGVTHMKEVWRSAGGDVTALVGGSLGYYKNSLYKDSFYTTANAELAYKLTSSVNVGIGAQVGAVTGYIKNVSPAGQIYARIEKEFDNEMNGVRSVFTQLGVIPAVTAGQVSTPATATVRVGISF